ncbi:Glucans biosynthesis glucosyltransferase H [Saezia sanguinis]|uniref:Glucans biosynthesis glucosyltransferase H n=1 Tax=Saezia sanguinis TaxID=1965230 RepID=A0A433SB44_9BURK|nr:glucans biosynthesis glucosyltransferase MdoH [Saezia sanguinis]RUS65864.1 Glucans biosynthesis glucosyltransferase H [Saezia sanguinis]
MYRQHSNKRTAPQINRGSMVPQPWQGFWKGLGQGIRKVLFTEIHLFKRAAQTKQEPWQRAVKFRRSTLALLTLSITAFATWLFTQVQGDYHNAWLQYGHVALFAVLSAWIIVGFSTALMGFWVLLRGDRYAMTAQSVAHDKLASDVRTAVIMPICNEDTATVFAGLRAIAESLAATENAKAFDVYVLSDSRDPEIIAAERKAWEELRWTLANQHKTPVEVYYRLRTRRVHRKAGNVADFCRRWGKNYRYMIVLDADSVMSGDCLVTLAKLMEANPQAGIIQTATQAVGQVTLHARVQQFAARVVGRVFTLGMQFWQLGESHYFGHNAIIRVEPFMKHCALAPIKGKGGLSGDIMSHDFVEAALMRRAGYYVWMVADLKGSYEQQPPDLLSELQRDRRWCQGNIQNSRLITEPGLHSVHRAMLATGFMSYFSAPLWMMFLAFGTALWLTMPATAHATVFSHEMVGLWIMTLAILFMPRLLGVLAVIIKGEQRFYGGTWSLISSSLLEAAIALLQAPIRMVAHTLFVLTALTGIKLEWKSPPREAVSVSWNTAFSHFASLILIVTALFTFICYWDAEAVVWLSPVLLPLLLVAPITVLTSQISLGELIRQHRLLLIPEEALSPMVLRNAWKHIRRALQVEMTGKMQLAV